MRGWEYGKGPMAPGSNKTPSSCKWTVNAVVMSLNLSKANGFVVKDVMSTK